MAGSKILVLGGTGPAGICLLRELIHRDHATVLYARNPSKVPRELASDPLVRIVKGEMDDIDTFSDAIAQCSVVLSLLGPHITDRNIDPTFLSNCYKTVILPTMRRYSVLRIFAMGTISIQRPEDRWTLTQFMTRSFVRLFASAAYQTVVNVADAFDQEAYDLEWTVFRIAQIIGDSDKLDWQEGRVQGELFTGWLGERGWTMSMHRAALARWLANAAEDGAPKWVRKMPAVSGCYD